MYILSKMVCTFHFVIAQKYVVAFIVLSCDGSYYQNVWPCHTMYLNEIVFMKEITLKGLSHMKRGFKHEYLSR